MVPLVNSIAFSTTPAPTVKVTAEGALCQNIVQAPQAKRRETAKSSVSEKSNAGFPKKRGQVDTVCPPGKGVELLEQPAASCRI